MVHWVYKPKEVIQLLRTFVFLSEIFNKPNPENQNLRAIEILD